MKFRAKLDLLLEWVLGTLLVLMVLNVLWQVFSRYVLNDPSTFTDELSRYLLIWVGILGSAYATGQGVHVAIDLLRTKLSPVQKHRLDILIQSLITLFAIMVLIIGGSNLVWISFELGQLSSSLKLPLGYVYLVLPLSGLLITFYSLHNIVIQRKYG